jgi:hypothetical protein
MCTFGYASTFKASLKTHHHSGLSTEQSISGHPLWLIGTYLLFSAAACSAPAQTGSLVSARTTHITRAHAAQSNEHSNQSESNNNNESPTTKATTNNTSQSNCLGKWWQGSETPTKKARFYASQKKEGTPGARPSRHTETNNKDLYPPLMDTSPDDNKQQLNVEAKEGEEPKAI